MQRSRRDGVGHINASARLVIKVPLGCHSAGDGAVAGQSEWRGPSRRRLWRCHTHDATTCSKGEPGRRRKREGRVFRDDVGIGYVAPVSDTLHHLHEGDAVGVGVLADDMHTRGRFKIDVIESHDGAREVIVGGGAAQSLEPGGEE